MAVLYFNGKFDNGLSWQMAWREYYENIVFSAFIYLMNIYAWRLLEQKFGNNFKSTTGAILILLFVGALGLGIGYFLRKRKENQKE